jgi:biopolymer transport protein ExbD
MRLGDSRRESDFEINVIPLIDVLLTLLMFFVLTTTFVRHASMQVDLPTASAQASATADPLIVMIDRDGHYYIGGHEVLGHDPKTLRRAIVAVAGSDRDRPVALRADAQSSHQAVVTAMDVLGQLGFSRLSIGTTHAGTSADGGP